MSVPRLLLTLLLALCLGLQGGWVRAASLAVAEGASAQAVPPCHEIAADAVDAARPDAGCSHCANCWRTWRSLGAATARQ